MNLSVFKEEKMKKDIIPDFKLDFEFNALYVSLSKYIYKKIEFSLRSMHF